MIATEVLAAKQALMKARQQQRSRTGRKRKEAPPVPLSTEERMQQRVFAFGLHVRGHSAAQIAFKCERLFHSRVTVELVERWIARGCPLA